MNLTIGQIAEATGGRLVYNGPEEDLQEFLGRQADSVVLDSRQVRPDGVFVATVGERADGHSFAESVYEKGAVLAVVQREPEETEHWGPYLLVENTLQALKEIAESEGISQKYLESIMTTLSKAGFVDAVHGKGGGYRLNRPAEDYTVGGILKLTEGSLATVSCTTA